MEITRRQFAKITALTTSGIVSGTPNTLLSFWEQKEKSAKDEDPKIRVVGIGGAGCCAIKHMIRTGSKQAGFIVADTDPSSKGNEHFEYALQKNEIPEEDLAFYAYPIGELFRRIGDNNRAALWFDRAIDAVGQNRKKKGLIDLAFQQKNNPKEYLRGSA